MSDLIERLEKAEVGSRELDAEIAVAVFETSSTNDDLVYAKLPHKSDQCAPGTFWIKSRSGLSLRTAEPYTTSIDAALTLVPEGAGVVLNRYWVSFREGPVWSAVITQGLGGEREIVGATDIPVAAVALCIAALKARSQS